MNSRNFSAFILVIALSFISVCCSGQTQDLVKANTQTETFKTIKLKVTGLTCSGDLKDIQAEVTKINGVISCVPAKKPSATTAFEIKYNADMVSEKELHAAVERTPGCSDPDSRPYKVKL